MAVVLMGVFMSVLDTNVVNLALPTITTYFHVDLARSQWVVTSYLIALTSFLLIFGRASEYIGKGRLFVLGFFIFTVSSLACGLSNSIEVLIICRAFQGIGASIALSIDMAILVQAFPSHERGKAIGFLATTIAIGSIAGPIMGGYVIDLAGWPYVFFLNVPVGIALILAALKYIGLDDAAVKKNIGQRQDYSGGFFMVAAVISLMLLLGKLAGRLTFDHVTAGLAFALAASLGALLYAESRHERPVVDLALFKINKFTFSNLSTILNYIAFAMFNVVMPFYLEMSLGYEPSQVGTALFVIPVMMALTAPISGWLYDKYHTNGHSSLGMLLMAIALLALGCLAPSMTFVMLMACFALYGIGNGLFLSPNNSEAMASLPPQKNSAASSMLATVRNLGNSIGVSMVSILLYLSLAAGGITEVTAAGPSMLSHAAGSVLIIAGLICIIGTAATIMVNRKIGGHF